MEVSHSSERRRQHPDQQHDPRTRGSRDRSGWPAIGDHEQRKKGADSKKKSTASSVKEVKIRSRTEAHDLAFKTAHIRRFLELGHRVKISVFFKGREIARPELGRATLEKMLVSIADAASPEGDPRMEGRNLSVMLVPVKSATHVAPASQPQAKEPTPQADPQPQKENS
jgi:translation initiation factor IF-3